jgi:hypothetical protein
MRIRFLKHKDAHYPTLGDSSAVLTLSDNKHLVLDYGDSAYGKFHSYYQEPPAAVFIAHNNPSYLVDLEYLFFDAAPNATQTMTLFLPADLVSQFDHHFANVLADDGRRFRDVFKVVSVSTYFYFDGLRFSVFKNPPQSDTITLGVVLPRHFLYTGCTEPNADVVTRFAGRGELVFHDMSFEANCPDKCLAKMESAYSAAILRRTWCYHMTGDVSESDIEQRGLKPVSDRDSFIFNC